MVKDIEEGRIPEGYVYKDNVPNWGQLCSLWNQRDACGVKFYEDELPMAGFSWVIHEDCGDFGFEMLRSQITGTRITNRNDCGLLGLSLINPKDTNVILTEGVSDYFSMKINCPNTNVLGLTNLGGSDRARTILVNLFDKFIYCCDNDEAGRQGAYKLKSYLEGYGKKVKIWTPPVGCKDVTDCFVRNIKLSKMGG